MKTIKEKAKRYDEALERAKDFMNGEVNYELKIGENIMCWVFPELRESEDERIRKSLLGYLYTLPNHFSHNGGLVTDWIAWLEKQKVITTEEDLQGKEDVLWCIKQAEKYAKDENEMGTCWFAEKWLEKQGKQGERKPTTEIKSAEESLGIDSDTYNKIVDECIYGDDEQKSADKVEPKFNVGDWITNGIDFTFQVCSIKDNMYLRSDDYFIDIETANKTFRHWTIQDAKDGDVLVASDGSIFLFKGTIDCACKYYVALTTCNDIKINTEVKGGYWETSRAVRPATKEQRNTLMKAMADAGYEWDAEKKELKKIKQKPAEIEKGAKENEREIPFSEQEWSEEDEMMLDTCIDLIEHFPRPYGRVIGPWKDCIDWLKSLRPQNTWKPSEEQMDALEKECIAHSNYELCRLLEQLKKLKG